jgi:hypothetical protein
MNLNDEVIAHIAKILQIAILTGTDIVDNLRQMRLQVDNNELYLDSEYERQSEEIIAKMLNEIKSIEE